MVQLSIIIPTYNEANTLKQLIEYVQAVDYGVSYEIVIVDDASIDRTAEKDFIEDLKKQDVRHNIRFFKNRINRGKGFSIRKGIQRAHGEVIIIQDADTEYDPRDIPKLIKPVLNNDAEVVYGSRFLKQSYPDGMAVLNYWANRFLTMLTNILFGLKLTDMETCYKVCRRKLITHFNLRTNRFTFEPEITAKIAKRKIAIVEIPISYSGRSVKEGKKIKARDFLFAVLILFKERFSRS